jgi:uncharacterized protein YutD
MIQIANKTYEVVVDHKDGWKPDAFKERYSDVLERYDYIVGDWGYNQLRMRGFFKETHPKATKESTIATLQDYLNEYCNFGCAYFIIEKVVQPVQQAEKTDDSEQEEQEDFLEASIQVEGDDLSQPQQVPQPQHNRHQRPHHSHQQRKHHHPNKPQSQQQQIAPKG